MGTEAARLGYLDRFSSLLGFLSFVTLVLFFGFPNIQLPSPVSIVWTALLPAALFLESLYRLLVVADPWRYLRKNMFRYLSLVVILLELSGVASWSAELGDSSLSALVGQIYLSIFLFAHLGSWIKATLLANRWLSNLRIPILSLPAITFSAVILVGALFLWMPGMRRSEVSFLDSLFTSASAVCVTGLTVYDAAGVLTPTGKTVLAALIQLGGLGTLTVMGMLAFWSAGRLSLGERAAFSELLGGSQLADTKRIVSTIVKATAAIEGGGAVLLWLLLRQKVEHPLPQGIFHAISAFCNAGFSVLPNALSDFSGDYLFLAVMAALIVAGGLGFSALSDLWHSGCSRVVPWRENRSLSRSTRFAVRASLILILLGSAAFYIDGAITGIQRNAALAIFQSATLRTAGFQLESQLNFGSIGLIFCFAFMAIGASPQSTAGGAKTTLVARLFLKIDTLERGRKGKRFFALQSFRIALALSAAYLAIAVASGVAIALIDGVSYSDALFESFSALGTVGLSRDLTPSLSELSKAVVILLMFTGRVLFPSLVVGVVRARRPSEGDLDWA